MCTTLFAVVLQEPAKTMPTYRAALFDVSIVCATIVLSFILRRRNKRQRLPLPPGPPGLPILGNLFQVPATRLWEKALDWGKTYGRTTIVYLP